MQRASNDTGWLLSAEGRLLGLALGYDFCAEHEWGIADLKHDFGVCLDTPEGLKDRKVTRVPPTFGLVEFSRGARDQRRKDQSCALLASDITGAQVALSGRTLEFRAEPGDRGYEARHDVVCAWDEGKFAILVRGDENIGRLKELHQAFVNRDIVFGSVIAEFTRRAGLTFVIDIRVSEEDRLRVLEQDLDKKKLMAVAAATGISERLKAAGRTYHALSPHWLDKERGEVHFWLNPFDQRNNNYGWFTVNDLDAWIAGQGPIPKKEAASRG